jgi:hypothetical protein
MKKLPSGRHPEAPFWGAMLFLVVVGLTSWAINAFFVSPDRTGWLRLQPDMTSWTGFFLGIGIWAGAGALCFVLLGLISKLPGLLRALAAMWRPVVLICAAGYLLFLNDQGRELGISLLGAKYGWPLFFLFLALCYWAANNWHTARLGIVNALERGALGVPPSQVPEGNSNRHVITGKEHWLYWPPRLLGVCAHLFAAINLSLAAWRLPPAAWGGDWLQWLAWSAPLSILFTTAFVWAEDVRRSRRGRAFATEGQKKWARWVRLGAIVGEIPLVVGLVLLAVRPQSIPFLGVGPQGVPPGFFWGTLVTSLSAAVFLGLISWLRDRSPPVGPRATAEMRAAEDQRQRREIAFFTIGLFLVAFLLALAVWITSTHVGGFLGSMVVAYFAFGAMLALVNAIELATESASGLTIVKQWFGVWATPRALGGCVLAFAVTFGVINAWLHPFHRVRLCDDNCAALAPGAAGFSVAILPAQRPTVAEAARAWYAQAKAVYRGHGPVPMLIVATAGGGIRAAYWTATVLEKLEKDFEEQGEKQSVRPYLFAISGVSGGSVGAAAFEAALTQRDENHCRPDKPGDERCPLATNFLKEDFLAPALASLVFQDAPSSFLPDLGQGDRGAALERSFEHASNDLLARPFLSFFRRAKPETSLDEEQGPWWRPILLLNATHEETGNRIITSHVKIERNVFVDSLDALNTLGTDVRVSTAAHNSARFTYVSPAGYLGGDRGSVIDGGYFENFGALSALELAHAATKALNDDAPQPKVELVILMISSDPDLASNHMLVRINESPTRHPGKCLVSVAERERASQAASGAEPTSERPPNYFSPDQGEVENALINEFLAPFQGLQRVREAHGNWAAAELALEVCADFATAGTPKADSGAAPGSPGEPPPTQVADVRDNSEDVVVDETEAVDVTLKPEHPYFAHLAMCETPKGGEPTPIQPPLGWVLSKWTEDHFDDLLKTCGNEKQLPQLETALRGKPPQVGGQEAQRATLAGAESH